MGKVYAFSDLHGRYDLWKKIKEYLKEDDIAYCLGDCCDRGPDGIKIIAEILEDNRIIYLLGNHEAALIDALNLTPNEMTQSDIQLLYHNGGYKTLMDFRKILSKDKQKEIKDKLSNLPFQTIYQNKKGYTIYLTHAGCDPEQIGNNTEKNAIWNRQHLLTEKWNNNFDYQWLYIVHGHTPVQALPYLYGFGNDNIEILRYCENHKIDLDLASFQSGKIALLDLDTLEPIYFVDNN